MMKCLFRNAYIYIAVQKGGVPRVPGYIEHTDVVTQLMRKAIDGKGDLAVLWLDLAKRLNPTQASRNCTQPALCPSKEHGPS